LSKNLIRETRGKNQDARGKNQESRIKRQESRTKTQEARCWGMEIGRGLMSGWGRTVALSLVERERDRKKNQSLIVSGRKESVELYEVKETVTI